MYEKLRQEMVRQQLIRRGISDSRVLEAMGRVERHLFVSEDLQQQAYNDCALPVGGKQTISQPYMVALMTQLLELKGDEKVLEIGTGSGYQAAVLSQLAAEVYTVERIRDLSERAEALLTGQMGIDNITFTVADGSIGLSRFAPYDCIIVTAGAPSVTEGLIEQLKPGGRLVIPVGNRTSQILYQIRKTDSGVEENYSTGCIFVPLIGQKGWDAE